MAIQSAGLLLYRRRPSGLDVFLIHMGGPIWAKRDAMAWSIPKGVVSPQEKPLAAAIREFTEETGFRVGGNYESLGTFRLNSGKALTVWALEGDCDPSQLNSNNFTMVWPPKSGQLQSFPEADRGGWFERHTALLKIVKSQRQVLEHLFARHAGG